MRCYICDYAPGIPSHYSESLAVPRGTRVRISYSHKHNRYTCDDCDSVGLDALSEMINMDEEYVFNSIEPTVKKKDSG